MRVRLKSIRTCKDAGDARHVGVCKEPCSQQVEKPERPGRWTAGLKAEKAAPVPSGVHFMQSYFPVTGPRVTLCCIFPIGNHSCVGQDFSYHYLK